jgi:hypothetical protein
MFLTLPFGMVSLRFLQSMLIDLGSIFFSMSAEYINVPNVPLQSIQKGNSLSLFAVDNAKMLFKFSISFKAFL